MMAEQMIQHKEGEKVATQAIPTGYKQTEVGVIPEDWSVESLSQVAQITRGKFSARPRNDPKFFGGDIPFIQTGDITRSNGYDVNFSQTINELGLSVSRLFPAGSLFFTIAANIGDVAIAKYPAACPDSLVVIKENGHINKQWLYHILSSKKEIFESIATSNAQLNINLEKLNPYVLGVPALEEQTAIANVLSDTDALIAGLEQLIAKKQAIKTATMQQLLTGRTRLPPFSKRSDGTPKGYKQSELGQIPEDWETSLLGGLADKIMVGIASAATHAYCKSGIPMLRNQNIKPNRLDSNDLLFINKEYEVAFKNKRLKAGDLLTARTGYPGTTCIIPDDFENAQSFTTLITRPTNKVNSKFLAIFMNSEIGVDFFDKNQIGGGQKNINASTLRTFIVAAPKLEEQTAIATIISDMDMEIVALEEKLAKTRDLKQGMMQQLLTGRIRLPLPKEV
ncbi:restriction endonuclease subunit S [Aeromonas caviae]|uniref:restriction endonuclease subunit S n=1 Tax=Aeromonas caviae TaxID=648 RepID=UPI002B474414|nr:restriction endonuclease subunit S [Aeromonas caviae]